jgi:ADP-ribosylglycohydrolase
MIGAIAGDIIGSIYEWDNIKTKDFELFGDRCDFTDDTVHTVAVADWLVNGGDLADKLANYTLRYKSRGYGGMLLDWAKQWERTPYNSWGNGSAMRVSPVAHFAQSEHEVLDLAEKSAEITHNHPEGIKGAQATALAMWMAREGADAPTIRRAITERFGYDLSQTVDEIREWYKFDVSCAGTVPQAITCALEAIDFEDAIRNAVSIGGDTDTVTCITGGIAEVMFGLPDDIRDKALSYLPDDMKKVVGCFVEFLGKERKPKNAARDLEVTPDMIEAYNSTTFRIRLPDMEVCLCPQSYCHELDRFLAKNKWDSAAVITAFNPRSVEKSQEANNRANQQLEERILSEDYQLFYGAGEGDDPNWEPEDSFLVCGIDLETGLKLAGEFGQFAIAFHITGRKTTIEITGIKN